MYSCAMLFYRGMNSAQHARGSDFWSCICTHVQASNPERLSKSNLNINGDGMTSISRNLLMV